MEQEKVSLKDKIGELEAGEVMSALMHSGWIKSKAARSLGITERMIGYKIKKYGIRKDTGQGGPAISGESPADALHPEANARGDETR